MRITKMSAIVAFIFCVVIESAAAQTQLDKGQYLDDLDLRDTKNGRDFILLHEFRYRDPKGTIWIVPSEATVNGASIPRLLWSTIGSPWTGLYRRASVIHDYFYNRPMYGSNKIHRVFYDAMITDGVDKTLASIMYYAVVRFNPRWEEVPNDPYACEKEREAYKRRFGKESFVHCYPGYMEDSSSTWVSHPVPEDSEDFGEVSALIRGSNMTIDQIETLAIDRHKQAEKAGR